MVSRTSKVGPRWLSLAQGQARSRPFVGARTLPDSLRAGLGSRRAETSPSAPLRTQDSLPALGLTNGGSEWPPTPGHRWVCPARDETACSQCLVPIIPLAQRQSGETACHRPRVTDVNAGSDRGGDGMVEWGCNGTVPESRRPHPAVRRHSGEALDTVPYGNPPSGAWTGRARGLPHCQGLGRGHGWRGRGACPCHAQTG